MHQINTAFFIRPVFLFLSWNIIHWVGELEGASAHRKVQQIAPLIAGIS
uniref:Uncharacterized protein n=1 Tax=Arundo donax TaxID=35708 RepID=A0A0A9EIE5_ARUDO